MPKGFGLFLILIFAGLLLFVFFLIFKRKSKGILGNRFFLPAMVLILVIVFIAVKKPVADYYKSIFKEAPYDFSELKSIVFKYGDRDNMENQYNSATGYYQYLNKKDSLIKTHLYLTVNDLLYLHRKAAEIDFWDFPSNETNNDTANLNGYKPPRFLIEFNYKRKSKKVIFDANYYGPQKLIEANRVLISEIQSVLSGAEDRQGK